ncbi:MAG: tetratricopeptide repeat protein [Nitrospinales bacterium]
MHKFFWIPIFISLVFPVNGFAQKTAEQKQQAKELSLQALELLKYNPFKPNVTIEAMAKLENAQKLNPEEPWVYLGFGEVIRTLGFRRGSWSKESSYAPSTIQKAIEYFEQALKHDPNHFRAHTKLAFSYITLGKEDQAMDFINKAHKIDDQNFIAWSTHLQLFLSLKLDHVDQIRMLFVESLKRAKTTANLLTLEDKLEKFAYNLGDFLLAEKIYRMKISREPENAYHHGNFGEILRNHKRFEEARGEFEKAVALIPYGIAVKNLLELDKELLLEMRN